MHLRVLVVGVVVALLAVPIAPPAAAAPTVIRQDFATGDDWSAIETDGPVGCLTFTLYANITGTTGYAWTGAIWLEGSNERATAVLIAQGSTTHVYLNTGLTSTYLGARPAGFVGRVQISLGQEICGTFTKFTYALEGAKNASIAWSFDNAVSVTTTKGGADGFFLDAKNFTGPAVEATYASFGDWGASAALGPSTTLALPAGMLAAFISTDQHAELRVTGPAPFGTQTATCTGVGAFGFASCASSGQSFYFLGNGRAATAPAGSYEFAIDLEAAVEGIHVYAVGAPVNW